MRGSDWTLKPWINYSKPSTKRRMTVWESDYRFVVRLSKNIVALFGQHRMMVREPPFHFLFLAEPIRKSNRRSAQGGAFLFYGVPPSKDRRRPSTCGSGR